MFLKKVIRLSIEFYRDIKYAFWQRAFEYSFPLAPPYVIVEKKQYKSVDKYITGS